MFRCRDIGRVQTAHKGLQKKIEHKEILTHAVNNQIKNVKKG